MNSLPPKLIRRPSVAPALAAKLSKRNESFVKSGNSKDDDDPENAAFIEKKPAKSPPKVFLNDSGFRDEIIVRLTADDPNLNKNEVIYSFKEKGYRLTDHRNHCAIHFSLPSKVVEEKDPSEVLDNTDVEIQNESRRDNLDDKKKTASNNDKLVNQFNYNERITQTPQKLFKSKSVQTEPPLQCNFSASALQWEIYDYYIGHEATKIKAKETDKHSTEKKDEETSVKKGGLWRFKIYNEKTELDQLSDNVRIMERITNQNTFDEITQDFKYWDDLSDEFKNGRGSLLPLWKFYYDKVKEFHVTQLSWNHTYDDLFVVSYGSYDFMKQIGGILSVFALSNPSHPEYSIKVTSGVMSLDIHKDKPNLIVTGMYDGNVAVFDLQEAENKPICQSEPSNGKHAGPVWQVKWQADDIDGYFNFCSASADGRVSYWTVVKKHLMYCEIVHIWRKDMGSEDFSQPLTITNASVTAIAFHLTWTSMLLIGTNDGLLYRCNKDYTQGILTEYESHDCAVHSIQWNYYHSNIFITGSPDHTVKTWDYLQNEPLWVYNLESPVMDTKWAPYSSTVFAALTKNGKIHVYDLHVNKYQPICVQTIVSKANTYPTSLSFSLTQPVVLVGDTRGCIRALKLSPNLRKSLARIEQENHKSHEISVLEKYIATMKDPKSKPNDIY
ncbi:cytoplasmic dynein with WD40 domain [Chamberlinius hualienensis]